MAVADPAGRDPGHESTPGEKHIVGYVTENDDAGSYDREGSTL